MEVPDLKLDAISFNQPPTKSQLTNMLRDLSKFVSHCAAAIVIDGSYQVSDQPCGGMFNAATMLKGCADQFEAGPNAQGLAIPQPGPMPVPRR
jgi:hypothetical protein